MTSNQKHPVYDLYNSYDTPYSIKANTIKKCNQWMSNILKSNKKFKGSWFFMTLSFYLHYPFVLVFYINNKIVHFYHKNELSYQFNLKKQYVPFLYRGQDSGTKKLSEVVKTKLKILFCSTLYSNNNTYTIKFAKDVLMSEYLLVFMMVRYSDVSG